MSKKTQEKKDEFVNVETALSSAEQFVEHNKKPILYAVGGVIVLVLLVLATRNFYLRPQENQAANEIYKAQLLFERDSFGLALNGNAQTIGFKRIADDYGLTASGDVSAAYAGICYFQLGDYHNAIKYLSQYGGKDKYFSTTVVGLTGDSYANLNEIDKAVSYFEKASAVKNDVTTPIYLKKAGIAYEALNKPEKALANYQIIKDDYPQSTEAQDIDKFIARVQK
ncbi:MAG: tetratricopeptide repeat protein [Prevotellaceae bacterium]|jgi:tetratricopeptide (TPR) repeat protein|nr:tetratricopeptide repeat protein [Prevotellaceae bacterium]